jgi:hypothetical protein
METDQLLVFDAADKDGLADEQDQGGNLLIANGAKIPISIREWFPVACQAVMFGGSDEIKKAAGDAEGASGVYWNNASTVLFTPVMQSIGMGRPVGPAAFLGRILLSSELRKESEDRFKWIVAHEITHALDTLRFLVPAVTDWEMCWTKLFGGGQWSEGAAQTFGLLAEFLDKEYGSRNELVTVKQYWPSQAEKWFYAWDRPSGPDGHPPTGTWL